MQCEKFRAKAAFFFIFKYSKKMVEKQPIFLFKISKIKLNYAKFFRFKFSKKMPRKQPIFEW